MAVLPLKITVYDGAYHRKGWIGAPVKLDLHPRAFLPGTGTITLSPTDPRLGDVTDLDNGARLVIEYKGEFLMSGWVDTDNGLIPSRTGFPTINFVEDKVLLWDTQGWPVPGAALSSQSGAAYYTKTGNAETILKDLVTKNCITRLGLPVTCATNLNRGATIPGGVSIRMQKLADVLYPALTDAGICVTVQQVGSGLVVDCYAQTTYPRTLTEESGILEKGSFSLSGPSATRVIGGGQGEGTARHFIGQTVAGREAAGRIIEVFRDARDASDDTILANRVQNTVDSTGSTASLSLSLSETANFRFMGPNGVRLGQLMPVQVRPGVVITEAVTEASIKWDKANGLVTNPILGDRSNDPAVTLTKSISAAFRAVRTLKSR
ncbi:Gp37-like protein [Arthrobacter sp. HY1533]|uniref:Gp37-like protein n=1 Tax=Arthrobacter sp. HY1533 TaxID=2970919 RepID=UPI0022B9E3A4|nr:hypothetical protein [Arthrobacter sp. HY1533]